MYIIETSWNWSGGLSKRSETKYIVLHHAAAKSCTAKQIDSWHKNNGWSGIGYHFFVSKDGSVYRGRPLWSVGAHVSGMNNCSIGICAEGDFDKETVMSIDQTEAIKELVDYLKTVYDNVKIVGHREIGASNCPGKHYPLDYFKNCESEGLTMTQYDELNGRLSRLENKMVYNYIDENMPDWAKESVRWCVENGIIEGTDTGLNLDDKDLKWCVVIKRLSEKING